MAAITRAELADKVSAYRAELAASKAREQILQAKLNACRSGDLRMVNQARIYRGLTAIFGTIIACYLAYRFGIYMGAG